MFQSELEKQVWTGVFTRYEPKGKEVHQRMRDAWALVLDLRESLKKLLAFGAWMKAAHEIVGDPPAKVEVFRSDLERQLWVSAFTRHLPEGVSDSSAEDRAKRAWEFVLDFRKPPKEKGVNWERAAQELAGGG